MMRRAAGQFLRALPARAQSGRAGSLKITPSLGAVSSLAAKDAPWSQLGAIGRGFQTAPVMSAGISAQELSSLLEERISGH